VTAITNLYMQYRYPKNTTGLPILIVVHGWTGDATTPGIHVLKRFAKYGLFACSVGLRGYNSAGGANDASRRCVYDVYDAIQTIRTTYADIVSATLVGLIGYSMGGATALACACKFPDTFAGLFDFFGMSDYGVDGTDGWYNNNGPAGLYTASLVTAMGGTPAQVPNAYKANDATSAILNYSGGWLYMYHDVDDAHVPVVHSTRIKTILDNASRTNYTYNQTSGSDSIRWLHGSGPAEVPYLATPEETFATYIKGASAWTIAASGTVTVIGYIVTKRFVIWLRANGTTTYGLDAAATVVYDTAADSYTVTPTTGAIDVTVTQGAKTGSATNINSETTITVT
jgi:dienelactone hydrolase